MRLIVATMLLALALGASGCWREPPKETNGRVDVPAGQGQTAAAAQTVFTTPAPRGEIDSFTWNLPNGEPSSLDAIKSYDYSNNTVLANMCESLLRQGPDFGLAPSLASAYRRVDPMTWVYTIRSGVRFWDGRPLTADDVVFSLSRNLDPEDGSFWSTPFYSNVASIEKTGSDRVTVKLKRPDALFNRMMATAAGAIGQRAYIERKGSAYGTPRGGIMCTGPFRLASWQPGTQIVLQRTDAYWDPRLRANARKAIFTFLTDESTIASALQSGSLDGTFQVPPAAVSQLASSGAGKLTLGASTEFFAVRQTERKGALSDLRVRRALSLALDRPAIARVILGGSGVPSLTPVQPAAWGYAPSVFRAASSALAKPAYDLERARRLVRAAGSPKTPITIALSAEIRIYTQTAQTLQSAARQIGLDVRIKALSTSVYDNLYFDRKARRPYDAFVVMEYGAGVAEPIVMLSEFTPLSAYNYGELDEPVITSSIRDALRTYDDSERAEQVTRAQRALVDRVGVITVVDMLSSVFQSRRITGSVASLAYLYYPWAAGIGST